MVVSILGCGWYGLPLAKELIKKGIDVKGSTTTREKLSLLAVEGIRPFHINLTGNVSNNEAFFKCDILWIAIPPKARSGRGSEFIAQLTKLIEHIKTHEIQQVVLISSTGVYNDDNTAVNERDAPNPDSESGKILLQAEELLRNQTDFTTTIIRFGGLIGPGRDPGRFFPGRVDIQNGDAPVNLIHLTDCLGISCALLDKKAFGNTFNAVAPEHPTRTVFYTAAANRSGLILPRFVSEKKNWKVIDSINVPELLEYNYQVSLIP